MSKWWFTGFFFRKKKTTSQLSQKNELDFHSIENTTPLSSPTRDRVRGPAGRKRPSKGNILAVTQTDHENHDSNAVVTDSTCHESSQVANGDDNFNQSVDCHESADCKSAQCQSDSIVTTADQEQVSSEFPDQVL
jgi:hypothetical protein